MIMRKPCSQARLPPLLLVGAVGVLAARVVLIGHDIFGHLARVLQPAVRGERVRIGVLHMQQPPAPRAPRAQSALPCCLKLKTQQPTTWCCTTAGRCAPACQATPLSLVLLSLLDPVIPTVSCTAFHAQCACVLLSACKALRCADAPRAGVRGQAHPSCGE